MKKQLLAGMAFTALVAGHALGADMPVAPLYKSPPPAVPFSWTGTYLGIHGGYAWGRGSTEFSGNDAIAGAFALGNFPSTLAPSPTGFVGGGQVGFNYQAGYALFGIETDLAWANIERSQTVTIPVLFVAPPTITNTSAETKLDAFGTFRLRFGITPAERVLWFVTGGFAYGHAKSSLSEATTIVGSPSCTTNFDICSVGSSSKWLGGWTVGGGFEFAVLRNWSVKAEYLYYNLGSVTYSFTAPSVGFPGVAFNATSDFRGQMFRAGLNYKFDGGDPVVAKY